MKALAFLGAVAATVVLFAVAARFASFLDSVILREMASGPSRHHTLIETLLISVPTLISGTVVPLILMRRRARTAKGPFGS